MILASCKHGEYMPEINTANMGVFTLDENCSVLIGGEDFKAKFNVKLYYPNDKIAEARIVGIKNSDPSTLSVLKDNITTLPLDMELDYQNLTEKFGNININDVIEIGLDIKMGNTWYPAFGYDGKSTVTSNLGTIPGANPVITLKKVAPLNIENFVGELELLDEFWEVETTVTVEKISDTEIKIVGYDSPEYNGFGNLSIEINTKDYTVSMPKQVVLPELSIYHNLAYEGSGNLDSYNGVITLSISATVDEGSFGGGFKFILGPKAN